VLCESATDFKAEWVSIHYIKPQAGWTDRYFTLYSKLNQFIETVPLYDNEFYCFFCDDDYYPPNFFDRIRSSSADVIICSMKRGDVPLDPHPTSTLFAYPENMCIRKVGLEQIFLKGSILKKSRFAKHHEADGLLIPQVTQHHKTEYIDDLFVWFNYLQPGRWTRNPLEDNDAQIVETARRKRRIYG
jgi:hypothetical protein